MAARSPSPVHVALLRGINVGGKNKLPMKDLACLFEDAGCREVRTYIQSGNVVFQAPPRVADTLAGRIADAIERRFGFRAPVVLRGAAELAAVARSNPFLARGGDADRLHVMFLASAPTKAQVGALDPQRSPPDEFVVRGREVYLSLPNGAARTKLTNAWFDAKLGTVSTGRNWRTVLQLAEMAS
jgi:uncharacterized protein (DUF1697 family)